MIKINLAKILDELNITQMAVTDNTGIRPGTVSAYYHGFVKRINVKDIDKLCDFLGCTPGELIEYIPNKK